MAIQGWNLGEKSESALRTITAMSTEKFSEGRESMTPPQGLNSGPERKKEGENSLQNQQRR